RRRCAADSLSFFGKSREFLKILARTTDQSTTVPDRAPFVDLLGGTPTALTEDPIMAIGTLAVVLLLASATPPADLVPMNTRNFQIPIQIAEGQRSKIKELILFSSSDEGKTWHEVAVATPDKDSFVFYAPTDGLYWFNICVV